MREHLDDDSLRDLARILTLEDGMPTLTPEAQRDLEWLITRLGKEKVQGPEQTTEPPEVVEWRVTLVRDDARKLWVFGSSPSEALARAREWVDGGSGFTPEGL